LTGTVRKLINPLLYKQARCMVDNFNNE
jgi:hypothetical protein